MGPSGIGKSTLLHMLAGIEAPSTGYITNGTLSISHESFHQRSVLLRDSISMIFQQPCLIAELTILENIMLKSIIASTITPAMQKRALDLLTEIGLADKAYSFPHQLSGGQQQRIAILRAIFQIPHFLLADEPTGNLDKHSADQIMQLLKYYQKKYAMGLIISTHDISIAQQCDVILRIQDHKIISF